MRVLILGGDGMLGHRLLAHLAPRHDVRVTLRQPLASYAHHGIFSTSNSFAGIDLQMAEGLLDALDAFKPEVVINVAGIIKQRREAQDAIASIQINALLPHQLARMCAMSGARLVTFSTDCVFSGGKGHYCEADPPDPMDLYGRTKLLGEVDQPGCLTIRTSIIGTELTRKSSLVEWFLAQSGDVPGYRGALFSGFTASELSRLVERILLQHPELFGVWHVSSDPISKFDLLSRLAAELSLDVRVVPEDVVRCDRTLNSTRFRTATGYLPPSWTAMLSELATDIRREKAL